MWVRIPSIKGNARQGIHLHWGQAGAPSESNGAAVFNASNGYVSVWHMNDPVRDTVGTVNSKDVNTTACAGMIGARPGTLRAGRAYSAVTKFRTTPPAQARTAP